MQMTQAHSATVPFPPDFSYARAQPPYADACAHEALHDMLTMHPLIKQASPKEQSRTMLLLLQQPREKSCSGVGIPSEVSTLALVSTKTKLFWTRPSLCKSGSGGAVVLFSIQAQAESFCRSPRRRRCGWISRRALLRGGAMTRRRPWPLPPRSQCPLSRFFNRFPKLHRATGILSARDTGVGHAVIGEQPGVLLALQAVEEDDSLVPWPPPVPRPAQPSTNTALPPSQGQDVPSMPGRHAFPADGWPKHSAVATHTLYTQLVGNPSNLDS